MKTLLHALTIVYVLTYIQCSNDKKDEEPHAYTISFFQFDPKDIGVGDHKQSKKDIKPSDLSSSNNTAVNNGTVNIVRNATDAGKDEKVQANHKHWNKTEDYNDQRNINNTETSKNEFHDTKKNESGTEGNKAKGNSTKFEDEINAKQSNTVGKTNSIGDQKSLVGNSTATKENATITAKENATIAENNSIGKNTSMVSSNSTSNNATSVDRRSKIKHFHVGKTRQSNAHKKFVLNPNPTPSQKDAEKYLKSPQYRRPAEDKPKLNKSAPLFQSNDSVKVQSDDHASLTEKSVTLNKNGAAKENATQSERKPQEENSKHEKEAKHDKEAVKDVKGAKQENNSSSSGDQNVIDIKVDKEEKNKLKNSTKESAETGTSKNETAAKLEKLEKDKKINKKIKENAKKILPVKNSFENISSTVENSTNLNNDSTVEGNKKQFAKKSDPQSYQHGQDEDDEEKDKIAKHRELLSHFVPAYDINPQERNLGFQLGSLKHPKHDLYPKCHHCPKNSTYSRCVKKKTLKTCKQGLNNICYSKSVKKHGVITYQMGCTDHRKCSTAKAFPCKNGNPSCFTCCQFDRCNSSPHHGDYELDELNMDELELDSKPHNDASNIKVNWFINSLLLLATYFLSKY